MDNTRKHIASIILSLVSLLGILPAVALITSHFFASDSSIATYASHLGFLHPAAPAVFALLFILGSGLSIYLSRKVYLVLLLPLLYLAVVPLISPGEPIDKQKQPFVYFGQTEPGKGFMPYQKINLTIDIQFPKNVRERIITSGKHPVILSSLEGAPGWIVTGSNTIYPLVKNKVRQDWSHGFKLFLRSSDHQHKYGHGTTTKQTSKKIADWPAKYNWSIFYAVAIPED